MMIHDAGYKGFFKHKEMVEALLSGYVKENFIENLDMSSLEQCSSEYITEDLQHRLGDCVWKIKWRSQER